MDDGEPVTGAQIRMARAVLRWSVADLARKANVGISSVQRIEAQDGLPEVIGSLQWRAEARQKVLRAVRDAFVRSGITFLEDDGYGHGVRAKINK